MSDKTYLYELPYEEEYYARFIKVSRGDLVVLVFNYTDADKELARRVAGLLAEGGEIVVGEDPEDD